ncbi:hypothetical protein JOF53_004753 [Crossiella equi]|uniref:Uncharacterized protein n=1 Tax=Crossiella equi TaxID=130796 RepID=A0ABS5AHP1_9PSEU|nr:hypothetical protein [Crossiella equi]MBP2475881.1 hypothetical protein [Crossiella equi]
MDTELTRNEVVATRAIRRVHADTLLAVEFERRPKFRVPGVQPPPDAEEKAAERRWWHVLAYVLLLPVLFVLDPGGFGNPWRPRQQVRGANGDAMSVRLWCTPRTVGTGGQSRRAWLGIGETWAASFVAAPGGAVVQQEFPVRSATVTGPRWRPWLTVVFEDGSSLRLPLTPGQVWALRNPC